MELKRLKHRHQAMKQRCYNPNCKTYKHYGARGIKMCDEWLEFKAFKEWALNNGYVDNRNIQLDRIDNDGNYNPTNCRYSTMKIQANNTRRNRKVLAEGELLTMSEISDVSGINYSTIRERVRRSNDGEIKLNTPKIQKNKDIKICVFGEMLSINQICKKYNLKYTTVLRRINNHVTESELIRRPLSGSKYSADDIEMAYEKKNRINFERQDANY